MPDNSLMLRVPPATANVMNVAEHIEIAFQEAAPLFWLGILGLTLAAACSAVALFRGMLIPPEGDLTKAISFDAAVGIYALTLGCLVPFAVFTPRGRRWWIQWGVALAIYAYGIETIQTLRGLDPRFSHHFKQLDVIAAALFVLVAAGQIVHFSVLALKLVLRRGEGSRGVVLLAIRYACLAVMVALAAGVWMMVMQGRRTGLAGTILPLHAAGFHGLQAIPIIALLFTRSTLSAKLARRWTHAAGLAWLAMCGAVAWQTIEGRPIMEVSAAMILAIITAAIWASSALVATCCYFGINPRAG
jgi:hypothetical protein